MAYLDDRQRVNGQIVLMTIPPVAFFAMRAIEFEAADEIAPVVNALIWISPIFVAIQVFKMWDGTAGRSWQNILCTILTAAAAAMVWQSAVI